MDKYKDITGKQFGRLTVLSFDKIDPKQRVALWRCKCICGKEVIKRGTALRYGVKSCGCLADENPKGKDSPAWKGGKCKEQILIRSSIPYKNWRKLVFERDSYTCKKCNIKGGDLEAHHICSFASNKELRLTLSNGITFCKTCHKAFHLKYSNFDNNYLQVVSFLTGEIFNVRFISNSNPHSLY